MCKKRKYYWAVIDNLGFELCDYTGESYKFDTEQEALDYIKENDLKDFYTEEFVYENL